MVSNVLLEHRKKVFAVLIAVVMVMAFGIFDEPTFAVEKNSNTDAYGQLRETEVVGLLKRRRKPYTADMSDRIKVTPANGRILVLSYYDEDSGKWIEDSRYGLQDAESDKVTLFYGDAWKNDYHTRWRIDIPASEGAGAYSQDINVYNEVPNVQSPKKSNCASAVVMDVETGRLIYSKNPYAQRKAASMTKMMSAILAVQNEDNRSRKTVITKEAANTPYGYILKEGDRVTIHNLIHSMMLPSANDAACATGIYIGGSTANFTDMMNAKARLIGCRDTFYTNAHGLDYGNNHSTAYDTALIGRYIASNEGMSYIRRVVKKKSYSFTPRGKNGKKRKKRTIGSTDAMLWDGNYNFKGIKTGMTYGAGWCFCGLFNYEGRDYVTVVMGAPNNSSRWKATRNLADFTEYMVDRDLVG